MPTTIKIIQDNQQRVTVNQMDPKIHFDADDAVVWVNTLTLAVAWNFPGAPSIFNEKEVNYTIQPGDSLTRHIDKHTSIRGHKRYTVGLAAMAAVAPGYSGAVKGQVPDQPSPDLDIQP
jgi:hypothetical protein